MENSRTVRFGSLASGFFKYQGKIFYAGQYGKNTLGFPVVDGKISKQTNFFPSPDIEVETISGKEEWEKFGLNLEMVKEFFGIKPKSRKK